ncbi:hypothetical protein GCM10023340_11250 [Nocardioides marinquilinus]|uniref:Uncharacterized protein n=1 Tax=Nocardioides marinquilinus TaxID=1210400 RepID=A0ABP9PBX0_9ACTN
MAESLSRELILPATRLAVPGRPSDRHMSVLAERSAGLWTVSPRDWATQQVVRLAVAALLSSRAEKAGFDPAHVTLGQLAPAFAPHVPLAAQAYRLAVLEAVNAGVPAAADPLRDALRRLGVTGREPLVMVALGLDRVGADGGGDGGKQFWQQARTSTTVTALVDAVMAHHGDSHRAGDVSRLDRRQLARADAVVLAGGRATPVALGTAPSGGGSWLPIPVALTRPAAARRPERGGDRGDKGPRTHEVPLRGEGWTEVFDTALDAVGAAMQQIDQGARSRGRAHGTADALANRLAAARKRTVAEVVESLRDIDPFVLEVFGDEVGVTDVRVAVPVVDDDALAGLWLSPQALAAPLVTGAADLFLGGRAEPRAQGGQRGGRGQQGGRPGAPGPRPGGQPGQPGQPGGQGRSQGEQAPKQGGSRRSKRGKQPRPGTTEQQPQAEQPASEQPASEQPQPEQPQPEQQAPQPEQQATQPEQPAPEQPQPEQPQPEQPQP